MLLNERISPLKLTKELRGDYQTIKRVVENISKLQTGSKRQGFKVLSPQEEHRLKTSYSETASFLKTLELRESRTTEGLE